MYTHTLVNTQQTRRAQMFSTGHVTTLYAHASHTSSPVHVMYMHVCTAIRHKKCQSQTRPWFRWVLCITSTEQGLNFYLMQTQ